MLKSILQAYYDWLAKEPIEHNIIIDKYGNIWHTEGDENYVNPSDKIDLDGAIDIHNHIEPHSFSNDDLSTMFKNKNTTFILVDKDYIYKARILKDLDIDKNYYVEALNEMQKLGIPRNEWWKQSNHFQMLEMQKDGIVDYARVSRLGKT